MLRSLTLGLLPLLSLLASAYYYHKRTCGKGYVASAAVTGIVSVFVTFGGIATLGAPDILVAWILRRNPEDVRNLVAPDIATVCVAAVLAIYLARTIFKIATAAIRSDSIPINSSALNHFETGGEPGLVALALAHWRYAAKHRPDEPVNNPGESPYSLPKVVPSVDWATLSADLLVQLEPGLDRESFRPVEGRDLYLMLQTDPFGTDQSTTWLIYAAPDGLDDKYLIDRLTKSLPEHMREERNLHLVACVQSVLVRDAELSHGGHRVRILTEGKLVNSALDFTTYAGSLVQRFERRKIPGTDYSLSDCFVRPVMQSDADRSEVGASGPKSEVDVLEFLDSWAGADGVSHISIIGEFGQGKSTALLAFCTAWAKRWAKGDRGTRIPLLIELRGKSPKRQSPEAFLGEWGQRFRLNGEALHNLVRAGQALLIFEGFDEIQDAGLRFERTEQFKALWGLSYPGTRVIFTGRPNFFLDTLEMRLLLKDNPIERDAGKDASEIFSLSFMNISGIAQALQRVEEGRRSEILTRCAEDSSFLDIARRPSMLPVIASQWEQIKADSAKEGITSAKIVRSFIEFLYARKEADLERLGQFHLLHRDVRHFFTQRVCWRMAADSLKNTISKSRFALEIAAAFEWLDTEFRKEADSDLEIATTIQALKVQFQGRPLTELLSAIAHDVRTYGLLVPDPAAGQGNLYFPHKQYFEFILGEVFWMRQNTNRCAWAKRLSSRNVATTLLSEPVSLLFASGLWNEDDLKRPIGTSRVKLILDSAMGLFVTLLAAVNVFSNSLHSLMNRGSKEKSHQIRSLGIAIRDIKGVPISLRPLLFTMVAEFETDEGVISYRPIRSLLFPIYFVMMMATTIFMMTRIIVRTEVQWGDYFFVMATMLIMTVALPILMYGSKSLRVCGLIMELYRFGSFCSIRPTGLRGMRLIEAAISRAGQGDIWAGHQKRGGFEP